MWGHLPQQSLTASAARRGRAILSSTTFIHTSTNHQFKDSYQTQRNEEEGKKGRQAGQSLLHLLLANSKHLTHTVRRQSPRVDPQRPEVHLPAATSRHHHSLQVLCPKTRALVFLPTNSYLLNCLVFAVFGYVEWRLERLIWRWEVRQTKLMIYPEMLIF